MVLNMLQIIQRKNELKQGFVKVKASVLSYITKCIQVIGAMTVFIIIFLVFTNADFIGKWFKCNKKKSHFGSNNLLLWKAVELPCILVTYGLQTP